MRCNRGDVVLVLFPDSNLQTAKRGPALVVQADQFKTGLPQTIVAMITSNMARDGHPSRVRISLATPAGIRSGLRTESIVMADNLATIFDAEIERIIGLWTDMALIDAALRNTLGI
jgi:mRNA interferase MazF